MSHGILGRRLWRSRQQWLESIDLERSPKPAQLFEQHEARLLAGVLQTRCHACLVVDQAVRGVEFPQVEREALGAVFGRLGSGVR
jgi:hypothetical protein